MPIYCGRKQLNMYENDKPLFAEWSLELEWSFVGKRDSGMPNNTFLNNFKILIKVFIKIKIFNIKFW